MDNEPNRPMSVARNSALAEIICSSRFVVRPSLACLRLDAIAQIGSADWLPKVPAAATWLDGRLKPPETIVEYPV
jgi:hypothetical protein